MVAGMKKNTHVDNVDGGQLLVYFKIVYLSRKACAPLFEWAVSIAADGSHLHSRWIPLESEVVIKFQLCPGDTFLTLELETSHSSQLAKCDGLLA